MTPTAPTCASASDRKSTRLNSSHANISYAVFCLKKKKTWLLMSTPTESGKAMILQRSTTRFLIIFFFLIILFAAIGDLCRLFLFFFFFFFNDTATTEIYTLSLHDALPISLRQQAADEGERTRQVEPAQ